MTKQQEVLVTGGGGFLGRPVVQALRSLGRRVVVLGRHPVDQIPCCIWDLTSGPPDLGDRPNEVYHLAGLAHRTPRTRSEIESFHKVNVEGTRNLLAGLEGQGGLPESLVFASTVAVYGSEEGELLDESAQRRATDPYGESKRLAEDLVLEWGDRHGVRVGVARLPLIGGPGAPGNLGAMVRALRRGFYVGVGDGSARRSMVLATDVAEILPSLARRGGVYHLTDGHHPSFAELEEALCRALGRGQPPRIPLGPARVAGRVGDVLDVLTLGRSPLTTARVRKMASTLTFSDAKARRELGWSPARVVDDAAAMVKSGWGTEE